MLMTAPIIDRLGAQPSGQQLFEFGFGADFTEETFTVPANVYRVSMIAVGAGARGQDAGSSGGDGGGGGALAYVTIDVTPGETFTVTLPDGDLRNPADTLVTRDSDSTVVLGAESGNQRTGGRAANCIGDAAFDGGDGGEGESITGAGDRGGGGGGAGGYSGVGGRGADGDGSPAAQDGSGGGGAGGGNGGGSTSDGGSVGLNGPGADGVAPGGDGSDDGVTSVGKGGGGGNNAVGQESGRNGGEGGVRIIWGINRRYPSTNTADA